MKTRFLLSIAFLLSGLLANAQDSDFITLQRDTVYVSGRGYIKRLRYKKSTAERSLHYEVLSDSLRSLDDGVDWNFLTHSYPVYTKDARKVIMDFLLPKVGEAPQEEVYLIFILYAGSDGYIYEVELGINSGVDLSVYDFDELCSRLRRCKLDFDRNYRAFVHARCVRANITINKWESWVEWMKLEKQELKEGKE